MLGFSFGENIHFAADKGGEFGGESREVATGMERIGVKDLNLNRENTTAVISGAQKFVMPVPRYGAGGEALVYPIDPAAPGYDAERAGKPIVDWEGKPIGESGIVFYNAKDRAVQAASGDGQAVIIINLVTREQADSLKRFIAGLTEEPNQLSLEELKSVLEFARTELGLEDMYNSDRTFINAKMTPVGEASTDCYGLMKRDDRDICQAVYVPGSLVFEGPAATPQVFEDGAVILQQGESIRGIQPLEFQRSYRHANGEAIHDPAQELEVQYPASLS